MSLILNDIHLPLLIKSTLSENHQYKTLPWNNLDQLSCLWAGKFFFFFFWLINETFILKPVKYFFVSLYQI